MTNKEKDIRQTIIEMLEEIIKTEFPGSFLSIKTSFLAGIELLPFLDQDIQLLLFGSSATGFGKKEGDLDICMTGTQNCKVSLKKVAKLFRKHEGG